MSPAPLLLAKLPVILLPSRMAANDLGPEHERVVAQVESRVAVTSCSLHGAFCAVFATLICTLWQPVKREYLSD